MNRFAMTCALGLGLLGLSQYSFALPITSSCSVSGSTCSEWANYPNPPTADAPNTYASTGNTPMYIGGTNITTLQGQTGSPNGATSVDPADFYQFVWNGTGGLSIDVNFSNIQPYGSAGDHAITTYGVILYKLDASNNNLPVTGNFGTSSKSNGNTICSKSGFKNTATIGPTTSCNTVDNTVNFLTLPTLSIASNFLISGSTYVLDITQTALTGLSNYSVTFTPSLNAGTPPPSVPEPGMFSLLAIGLASALANCRIRKLAAA